MCKHHANNFKHDGSTDDGSITMDNYEIKQLSSTEEWFQVFHFLKRLDAELDRDQFIQQATVMNAEGHHFFSLSVKQKIVVIVGGSIHTNFCDGKHLYISELLYGNEEIDLYIDDLFVYLQTWAKQKGCKKIIVSTNVENERFQYQESALLNYDESRHTFVKQL